jgi:hypothetical protein
MQQSVWTALSRGSGASESIFDLTHQLIKWTVVKSHERSELGQKWLREDQVLTKYWEGKDIAAIAAAGPLAVDVAYHNGPVWWAQVSVQAIGGTSIVFVVEVDANTFETKCPCLRREEFGDLCWHTLSLILKDNLHPNDPRWYHESFRVRTYIAVYSAERPQITTSGTLQLRELLPPEHKGSKGRPKKKGFESGADVPSLCGVCGVARHMSRTCPEPSTKSLVDTNWKQAISYAQQLVALGIQE